MLMSARRLRFVAKLILANYAAVSYMYSETVRALELEELLMKYDLFIDGKKQQLMVWSNGRTGRQNMRRPCCSSLMRCLWRSA